MVKKYSRLLAPFLACFIHFAYASVQAEPPFPPKKNLPSIIPSPPTINAKSYVLMDANSGKILAEKNMHEKNPPASLTKIMTTYLISQSLKNQSIRLNDTPRISKKAWQMGGAKMFVRVGTFVPVQDLIQGIVVTSGNDSCVAMAEHIASSEEAFSDMMNAQAELLGMKNSHFINSTGMPDPNHYTTAYDLALLSRALILHFPDDYKWYEQKWFTYNKIRQPNRNRLLWRYTGADGLKTGRTDEAGFCLVASAEKNGMRLISVILGAPSDEVRSADSIRLLTYGFRFFNTHMIATAYSTLDQLRIFGGRLKTIPVGVNKTLSVTTPRGKSSPFKLSIEPTKNLRTPIKKGQQVGKIHVTLNNQVISTEPLIALENNPKGGIWRRSTDWIACLISKWFSVKTSQEKEISIQAPSSKD